MQEILDFLIKVGKLKGKTRRGWQVHRIPRGETTAEHIFRMAIVAWVLGEKKGLNVGRAIKIALAHDLCEIYAPDITPYDPLLPRNQKKITEILKKWPEFTPALKRKRERDKYRSESHALDKVIAKLPVGLRAEIKGLWLDFEKGLTKEGRFVKQVDKVENLLQGLEYWKKYGRIRPKLWMRWIKEILDDPILVEFMRTIENNFCGKCKK
jgi:putative hydrolase of HD superfamily